MKATGPNNSRAFGAEIPQKLHIIYGGSFGKEFRDLRDDIDRALIKKEARNDYPDVTWIANNSGTVYSAGGLLVVKGTDLLQGQSFEALTHGTGNAALTFTALKPGKFGYSVAVVDTGSVSVAYNAGTKLLTVNINAGVTTGAQAATAVNAAGSAAKGIIRCVAGGTGGGNPVALAATAFTTGKYTDGYGAGFTATISGVEALPYHETGSTPSAAIGDTEAKLTLPDLTQQATPRSADDPLVLVIESDGAKTRDFQFQLNQVRKTTTMGKLSWIDSSTGTAMSTGGYIPVRGENMLHGQSFDALVHGTGASALTFTAMKPGKTGYSIELLDTGAESVVFAAGKLTVNFDGPLNTNTSTANSVATVVNAVASACHGYIRCVSGGAGAVAALAETDMAGGLGSGFTATVSGVEALPYHETGTTPSATITDTIITLQLPDLTGETPPRSADDQIELVVVSDGCRVGTLSYRSCSVRLGYPRVNGIDNSASTYAAVGGDLVIDGTSFLQNQTFDSLTHGTGADALAFHALKPGNSGYSVEITDSGGATTVAYAAGKLSIGVNAGALPTTSAVATAVNAAGSAAKGIIRCVGTGGGNVIGLLAETVMAGGAGGGFSCYVGGTEALPAHATGDNPPASIADDQLTVTVPTPAGHTTPRTAEDMVSIVVETDGIRSHEFNFKERHVRPNAPEIHNWDGAAVNNANNAIVLNGVNLLQGQLFDSYRFVPIAGGYMDVTSMLPGAGTGLTIALVNGGGADVVAVVGTAISVDYNPGVSTTDSIATAINTDATAGVMVRCWSDAANAMAAGDAMGATPLTGGVGGGMTITTGGTAATPTVGVGAQQAARITDTALTVTTGDMNADWGAVAGDTAVACVISDGVYPRVMVSPTLT